jgi:anti-sigma factor RsiW
MRRPRGAQAEMRSRQRDILAVSVPAQLDRQAQRPKATWPPVPDLFDVITYFRARGDSFTLIASIGFWIGDDPKKALTARGLKLWYEGELDRRAAAKATIR